MDPQSNLSTQPHQQPAYGTVAPAGYMPHLTPVVVDANVRLPDNFPAPTAAGAPLHVVKPSQPTWTSPNGAYAFVAPTPLGPKPSVLGNGKRRCGNCCITPRGFSTSFYLVFAVLFPVSVFLTSVEGVLWWSYLVTLALTAATLLMLMFAVTCDPGILLPDKPDPTRQSETLIVNGVVVECKVCPTCHIVRPPRSGHCQFCDWCVEEFDHHCGVLGSCVAKRTFRFFAGFMWFGAVLSLYVFVRCIVVAATVYNYSELSKTNGGRWQIVAAFGCILYTTIGGLCLAGQGGVYCFLSCKNSTQKEQLHLRRLGGNNYEVEAIPNPYHQGYLRNFYLKIVQPLQPSRIQRDHV